jgi:hypothetical protein
MIRAIALAVVWGAVAFAQDTTVVIEGQVTDPSGAAVTKGGVEVSNPAKHVHAEAAARGRRRLPLDFAGGHV